MDFCKCKGKINIGYKVTVNTLIMFSLDSGLQYIHLNNMFIFTMYKTSRFGRFKYKTSDICTIAIVLLISTTVTPFKSKPSNWSLRSNKLSTYWNIVYFSYCLFVW